MFVRTSVSNRVIPCASLPFCGALAEIMCHPILVSSSSGRGGGPSGFAKAPRSIPVFQVAPCMPPSLNRSCTSSIPSIRFDHPKPNGRQPKILNPIQTQTPSPSHKPCTHIICSGFMWGYESVLRRARPRKPSGLGFRSGKVHVIPHIGRPAASSAQSFDLGILYDPLPPPLNYHEP